MSERDPLKIVGATVAEKYRIERMVGEGGFAVVYRALHTIWNKPVAIKFFNGLSNAPIDQREQFHQAFIQEGALLTELSSHTAGIVQARDVGTYTTLDGQWMPYMVLEWLDGYALDELIDRERARGLGPWSVREVAALLSQVCAALDVAHGKGIAHRDIKPPNLFVVGPEPSRDNSTLKILDFGVAKMMSDNTQLKAALAKTGMSVTSFTPQYGAPEQFTRSYGATGPWTDVFALALVGVELLAGRPALDGADLIQLGFAAGNPQRRPTPRALGVEVSDEVERVFATALAVLPQERYARARELAAALHTAATGLAETVLGTTTGIRVATAATELLAPPALAGRDTMSTSTPSTVTTQRGPSAAKSRAGLYFGLAGATAGVAAGAFFVLGGQGSPGAAGSAPSAATTTPARTTASAMASAAAPVAPTCPEGMALIKSGQFFQGSDAKDAPGNEKPAHNVSLTSYCIDLYEVRARDYRACSDVGKCKRAATEVEWPKITPADKKTYSPLCTIDDPEKGDHPVNCVSWEMANTYCKAQDKRLPSEAEWEYATRGPDGRVYPWGDDAPTSAHLNACGEECVAWGKQNRAELSALYPADDGYATTAPVGKFDKGRSRFGPYDVVGNVWEWVADWYGDYDPVDKKNPTGPESGERRVIRGGAWNGSYASWLRPSFRYAQAPGALSHGIGFRCARSLP